MRQISLAFVIAAAWLDGHAQSSLPPCPSDTSVTWTNCFGTITFNDGAKYVGEFLDGKYHGQGTGTFADGTKYVGEFLDGKYHGQGTYTDPDGSKHVGEYRDDKPNGKGTATFANGAKYVGEYRDGLYHGQGAYTQPDGSKHMGEYRNGTAHGQGVLISAKGYTLVEGIWEGDRQVSVGDIRWYRTGDSDILYSFVQPQSIRQEGAFRRAWLMWANTAPDAELKILSARQLMKFDCANERNQILTASAHSGSFGTGTLLLRLDESGWQYIPPGTVIHGVMKYVCDYKLTPVK